MSTRSLFIVYGAQAGIFASLASVFGKLALNENDVTTMCLKVGEYYDADLVAPCSRFSPVLRAFSLGLIFACNSLMWLFFTKAMNASSTTAAALAVNSAANFLFTGFAGMVLFGETLTVKWAMGTFFIIAGLACINLSLHQSSKFETTGSDNDAPSTSEVNVGDVSKGKLKTS